MLKKINCKICSSDRLTILNTYKHYAVVCGDCNCVFHVKKSNYLFEYLIPRKWALKILPAKAFLRLFSDKGDFRPEDFYNAKAFDSTDTTSWRVSEVMQVSDQLALAGIDIDGKKILDISGGPGYVGEFLKQHGADVIVTEYSNSTVQMMRDVRGLKAETFDYNKDNLQSKFPEKFDLIMMRSSIIFCADLDALIEQIKSIIKPSGIVFLESILPSYGEIFWWQQLEYKFPYIYSQETIEKKFFKNGFKLKVAYKDHGSYSAVKLRSYDTIARHVFTWMIEYPMVLVYRLLNIHKRAAIDSSMDHKMITQFWTMDNISNSIYKNYPQGGDNRSKTFGFRYNGYLSKIEDAL